MSSPKEGKECEPVMAFAKSKPEERKRNQACDTCRRRKVRCDGDSISHVACSNCKAYNNKCTYAPKRRAVDPEYIQFLETQLAQTQEALQKLSAKTNSRGDQPPIEHGPSGMPSHSSSTAFPSGSMSQPSSLSSSRFPPLPSLDRQDPQYVEDGLDDEGFIQRELLMMLDKNGHKHLGKSSSAFLLQQALDMKAAAYTVNNLGTPPNTHMMRLAQDNSRHNPWVNIPPYQYTAQDFPEPDLLQSLINLYFEHSHIYIPLLNRIIFMRDLDSNLHLRDESFGSTVLLVCAIGSRYSNDQRVLLDGVAGRSLWYSAGWPWFRRVQQGRKMLDLRKATLYDVQVPTLAAIYFNGSPTIYAASANVAYAIRLAINLGAHKRKTYKTLPNAEDELLKRAFWAMVVLDRYLSSVLGQPCCIQDEDYDLAYPIECDDEYWFHEDPKLAFKQPIGKPALVSSFICYIKLQQIHAAALRTVYANSKSKAMWGIKDECQTEIVAVLDSSLNEWIDSIPPHLKWDPDMPDTRFMHQSAQLHSTYYYIQISVHRSFIPVPSKPANNGDMALPSLAICTNAARACIHMLEGQFKRSVYGGFQNFLALFNAGIVLALNTWATKQSGITMTSNARELDDIFKCVWMLKALEPRIYITSQSVELLKEITLMGNAQFPGEPTNSRRGNKRTRDGDEIYQARDPSDVTESNVNLAGPGSHAMAGSQRTQQQQQTSQLMSNSSTLAAYIQQKRLDPGVGTAFPDQMASPEEAYRFTLNAMGLGEASDAYSLSLQQRQTHRENLFTPVIPSSSNTAMNFHSPPFASSDDTSPDAWSSNMASSSAQRQINDLTAATHEPQLFDTDVLAMLSSAPTNLELGDWGAYLNNLTDVDNVRDISAGMSQL